MNEKIEDIVLEMRKGFDMSWHDVDREWAHDLADRIEAAHNREFGELKGERKGILKANEAFAADNTRLRGELAAKDEEIARLKDEIKCKAQNYEDVIRAKDQELERLRVALKPVLELKNDFGWELAFQAQSADAVREAQRIYKEVAK